MHNRARVGELPSEPTGDNEASKKIHIGNKTVPLAGCLYSCIIVPTCSRCPAVLGNKETFPSHCCTLL